MERKWRQQIYITVGAMELTHLADYFMQEKFSDADLVILGDDEELVASTNDENEPAAKRAKLAAEAGDKVLAKFPAHRLALVGTDYFKAQVRLTVNPETAAEVWHAVRCCTC